MEKRYYCPFCGKWQFETNTDCIYCKQHTTMVPSKYEFGYYVKKSMELYGNAGHYEDILFEEEISKNPLYDEKFTKLADEHLKAVIARSDIKYRQNQNRPKCPTCQSTNLKKISATKRATHGYLFGIFSKTAFSQFECKNCGYKW